MREELAPRHVPIAGPSITDLEVEYVTEAVRSGWYGGAGQFEARFEQAFARYVGVRYAVSLPSCTSAIHLSLLASGVGIGDEVIVPDATWIASAAPVTYVGATPIFADVDPASWCLDTAAFESAITPRTRAVIPVDLYGGMPDLPEIRQIAEQHGIAVIEDAAEAIGSRLAGRPAGSFGDAGVFSFHGSKTLTTGEGGMLVTDSDEIHARAMVLRDHGRQPGDTMFRNSEIGWKYKMSGLQAALGLAQLERIEELVDQKRRIFSWYQLALGRHPAISLNAERDGLHNSYWMVTAVFDPALGLTKESVIDELASAGIDSRPFFYPLSSLASYADASSTVGARERNPVSYRLGAYGLNLPSALSLGSEDVERVCEVLLGLPELR